MALKFTDKLKSIDLSKAGEVVSSVTNSLAAVKSSKPSKVEKTESSTDVIDSLDGLSNYLYALQPDASPAVTMALQSQLQVLQYVQSPTMTLMVVDNVMVMLHKALKSAESNEQREALRESFASLLQSLIFVTEARLRYEVDSNKEESVRLLADAGDMLMNSVSSTAMMVVPIAAGVKVGKALPRMVNVLSGQNEQKGFLARLMMVKGKKAIIEEKKAEFDKTLNYIFDTLDSYAELIGPSIQLHGMLKRYADGLLERYKMAQYDIVAKRISENEGSRLEKFANTATQCLETTDESTGIKLLIKAFADLTHTRKVLDYDSVSNILRALHNELEGYEAQNRQIDDYIIAAESELKSASFLQFGLKNELQTKIEQYRSLKLSIDNQILDCRHRINIVSDIIEPINESIQQYEEHLQQVVQKFVYAI